MLLPFIGIIVFTGIYPKPMFDRINPSVDVVVARVEEATGANVEGGPVFVPSEEGDESDEHEADEPAEGSGDEETTVTTEAGH